MSNDNWKHKDELQKKAQNWEEKMKKELSIETMDSVINSCIYTPNFETYSKTKIITVQDTSQAAIFKIKSEGKMAVLNFASYKKPGGGYINGAMAQEESLCHSSNLYQVLTNNDFAEEFYGYNNEHLNKGLYESRILYTPDIVFFTTDNSKTKKCNVITCAAPNKKAAQKYQQVPDYVINNTMKDRILSILHVAMQNEIKVLILGAFGCGVFENDPTITAKIFKECLTKYHYYRGIFDLVVFAVPDTPTYTIFKEVMDN